MSPGCSEIQSEGKKGGKAREGGKLKRIDPKKKSSQISDGKLLLVTKKRAVECLNFEKGEKTR